MNVAKSKNSESRAKTKPHRDRVGRPRDICAFGGIWENLRIYQASWFFFASSPRQRQDGVSASKVLYFLLVHAKQDWAFKRRFDP
jgi:hypothetical protein